MNLIGWVCEFDWVGMSNILDHLKHDIVYLNGEFRNIECIDTTFPLCLHF